MVTPFGLELVCNSLRGWDTTRFWHLTAKLILFIEADNGQKWKTEEVDKTDIYQTKLN